MTNEREPLWSDERIKTLAGNFTDELDGDAGTYHLFCVAMGSVRSDYEARITELEAQVAGKEALIVQLIEIDMPAIEDANERLEARLAQTPTIPPDVRDTMRGALLIVDQSGINKRRILAALSWLDAQGGPT